MRQLGSTCGVLLPQKQESHSEGFKRRGEASERCRGPHFPKPLERSGDGGIQQHEGQSRGAQVKERFGCSRCVPTERKNVLDHGTAEHGEC